jgi:hypothetical protein
MSHELLEDVKHHKSMRIVDVALRCLARDALRGTLNTTARPESALHATLFFVFEIFKFIVGPSARATSAEGIEGKIQFPRLALLQ